MMKLAKMERRNGYNEDLQGSFIGVGFCEGILLMGWWALCIVFIVILIAVVFTGKKVVESMQMLPHGLLKWIIIGYCCLTLVVAVIWAYRAYNKSRLQCYFHADIPRGISGRWAIIMLMIVLFPMYIVSRYHLWQWDKLYGETNQPAPELPVMPEPEQTTYQKFCLEHWPYVQRTVLTEKDAQLKKAKTELDQAYERVRSCQNVYDDLKEARDEYARKKATPISESTSLAIQEHIAHLPGVYAFGYEPRSDNKLRQFYVNVAVRFRVRGYLYDLGEYQIRIFANQFECQQIRSGRLPEVAKSPLEYINAEKDFLFDPDKLDTIMDKVTHGEYDNALTLIVRELHLIDQKEWPKIPEQFRRLGAAPS